MYVCITPVISNHTATHYRQVDSTQIVGIHIPTAQRTMYTAWFACSCVPYLLAGVRLLLKLDTCRSHTYVRTYAHYYAGLHDVTTCKVPIVKVKPCAVVTRQFTHTTNRTSTSGKSNQLPPTTALKQHNSTNEPHYHTARCVYAQAWHGPALTCYIHYHLKEGCTIVETVPTQD